MDKSFEKTINNISNFRDILDTYEGVLSKDPSDFITRGEILHRLQSDLKKELDKLNVISFYLDNYIVHNEHGKTQAIRNSNGGTI